MATSGWQDPKRPEITPDWNISQSGNPVKSFKTMSALHTIDLLHDNSSQDQAPQYRKAESHALDVAELIAITSQKSKGLQVIEVTPRLLNVNQFACLIPVDEILDTKGTLSDYIRNGPVVSSDYFKSVEFPIVGNYLKFEILPSRYQENGSSPNYNRQISGYEIFNDYFFLNLINTGGKSIKLKHGDVIKSYFDDIIITFPQCGPRFRITVGFNSEYAGKDYRAETLHLGDAPYIQSNQTFLRPTPVNITNTNADDTAFTIADNTTAHKTLLQSYLAGTSPVNVHNCMWISGFNFTLNAVKNANAAQDVVACEIGLDTYNVNSSTVIKKLFSEHFLLDFTAAATTRVIKEFSVHFAQPIRAQISEYLALALFGTVANTTDVLNVTVRASVYGYALGPLTYSNPNILGYALPLTPAFQLDMQPYSIDGSSGV